MNATQPAMAFPGLLATIHPTEGYKESNDDFDIGVQKLTRKASIENLGLDALLDVEAETVNLILGLDEPFQVSAFLCTMRNLNRRLNGTAHQKRLRSLSEID